MSDSKVMARLSGWANKDRRKWIAVAENAGYVVERQDRDRYSEWWISRDGDMVGVLHEFPEEVYAFVFTSWEVAGRVRRIWHRLKATS